MSSSIAIRKLKREYASLAAEPPHPGIIVRPLETNFLHAHFLLTGESFHGTPYEGGVYHGVLQFPKKYPFEPPGIVMRTHSGRFKVNAKICFSMSDFHPESWQPSWTIRTIMTGFVSFMNGNDITTGGMDAPAALRIKYAVESLTDCMESDDLAMKIFDDVLESIANERADLGPSWPPARPIPIVTSTQIMPKQAAQPDQASSVSSKTLASVEPGSGKNASKNKKKREKEKRKKVATKFLSDLNKHVPSFLRSVVETLKIQYEMDVTGLHADHVCYRTNSMEQYESIVGALKTASDDYTLLVESEIGGRQIATFKLSTPIPVTMDGTNNGGQCPIGNSSGTGIGPPRYDIDVIEIPSPKDGSPYNAGLEHVEFVVGDGTHKSPMNGKAHQTALKEWMEKHPAVNWKTKALDKECNPDVSMMLDTTYYDGGKISVKFHLLSLEEVIKIETTAPL